jgi:preprotein translocase subunit SecE
MSAQTNTDRGIKSNAGFLKGIKSEFKKITWPTRDNLIKYTITVIVICFVVSLLVWLIDTGLHRLLSLILR